MFDLALDPSDTRSARDPSGPVGRTRRLRFVVIGGACAVGLTGFAVAASSLLAELIAPPRPLAAQMATTGRAADWPELKDGLPALAGAETTVAAEPSKVPPAPRMASVADPLAFSAPDAKPTIAVGPAPSSPPTAGRPVPEAPAKRIPVPTPVAVLAPPSSATIIVPTRTAALVMPLAAETVRARGEVQRSRDEAVRPREEASEKVPSRQTPAVALGPVSAALPEKPRKVAAACKTAPSATSEAATVAEAEPEETDILGVRLPSLAPAGRKLQEGVDALGNAVRSAF